MPPTPDTWTVTIETPSPGAEWAGLAGTHTLSLQSTLLSGEPWWQSNGGVDPYVLLKFQTGTWKLQPHASASNVEFRKATLQYSLTNTFSLFTAVNWTTPATLALIPGTLTPELQHSPADILRHLLVQSGSTTLPVDNDDWPIATDQELGEPDNTITTYDTVGKLDGNTQDGEIQEHYGFQIRLRSGLHTDGYKKLLAIRNYLSRSIQNVDITVDSTNYRVWCVTNLGSINRLGKDGTNSRRRLFTLNGTIVVTQL